MYSVREIDILIHELEERLEGLQAMAELEDETHYGTAAIGLEGYPEVRYCKERLYLEGLRLLRNVAVEDEKAHKLRFSEGSALRNSDRVNVSH